MLIHEIRQSIKHCNVSPPNWKDDLSLSLGCLFHDEYISMYRYTLNKTYNKS